MAKEKYLSPRPWRRQGHLLKHPEIDLVIADFFPIREGNKMVHPDTDSAREHAEFALRACNAHDALLAAIDAYFEAQKNRSVTAKEDDALRRAANLARGGEAK